MSDVLKTLRTTYRKLVDRERLRRLRTDIAAHRARLPAQSKSEPTLTAAEPALTAAEKAVGEGEAELAWKCLHAARMIELSEADETSLQVQAITLAKEADQKLGSWRKEVVKELWKAADDKIPLKNKVLCAALILNDHFNNEAHKDSLRRKHSLQLSIFLIVAIGALLLLARNGYLAAIAACTVDCASDGRKLLQTVLSMAAFGFLGATVSAVTEAVKPGVPTRIPELVSSLRITLLRLMTGPASAIFLYFAILSPLGKAILKAPETPYLLVLVAFVAGFSERLVLRVVEAVEK